MEEYKKKVRKNVEMCEGKRREKLEFGRHISGEKVERERERERRGMEIEGKGGVKGR